MPRELIDTGTDKRYVRRNKQGQFKDVVDVGKSLSQDRRRKAKRTVKAGEGDRGDQKPRKKATSARTGAKRTTTRATAAKKATALRTKKKAPTRPRSKPKTISKARGRTKR